MTHTRIHLKGPFRELNLKGPIRTSSFGTKLLLLLQAPTLVLRPRGRRALQSGSEMSPNSSSLQNEATSVPYGPPVGPPVDPPVDPPVGPPVDPPVVPPEDPPVEPSRSTDDAAGPPGPKTHAFRISGNDLIHLRGKTQFNLQSPSRDIGILNLLI